MTRVLVTGASGMLGRAVAARLVADGHDVRTLQRSPSRVAGAVDVRGSITDGHAVRGAVRDRQAVVHLAAKVSITGPLEEYETVNVGGTRVLLDEARAAGVERFVHVSSPSVAHVGRSLLGAGAAPADPERARGSYARTKARSEVLALAAHGRDGLGVIVVRPHVVWGPGDTQLVGRVVDRARSGRLPVLGHGAALIDTTYVDNAVDALVAALHAEPSAYGQPYVVTNGEPRPVVELLAGICAASGVPIPRRHVPAVLARGAGSLLDTAWRTLPLPGEPPLTRFVAEQLSTAHWFDQRRTRDALGWVPRVTLDDGLARLAAWTARQQASAAP
ncbi:NAD-dependent epimerase/dehydratase family protein [Cellulomonas fengjieae]|uniref:SDR family NAD(P)-dependent oxidoreductase n=1 Tax=Cellulomonas fengjieae TaxID=2819978 RepID=A0ABS3SEX4_9CELL|nr:SDR family NAD(P)-dependent oxidoreductase [Cellulomonas fengjieae]MBO3084301.1 SDR family NAD(P)-dependent oxidoreductase [Cellulomonas fengjieae]QVI68067.1 SDR family NAD(P)-dependent oxidoreductase [Cellulomonas fengjieae]